MCHQRLVFNSWWCLSCVSVILVVLHEYPDQDPVVWTPPPNDLLTVTEMVVVCSSHRRNPQLVILFLSVWLAVWFCLFFPLTGQHRWFPYNSHWLEANLSWARWPSGSNKNCVCIELQFFKMNFQSSWDTTSLFLKPNKTWYFYITFSVTSITSHNVKSIHILGTVIIGQCVICS